MAIHLHYTINQEISFMNFLHIEGFSDDLLLKYRHHPFAFQNNTPIDLHQVLSPGAEITLILPDEINTVNRVVGELKIVYEDPYLLIVDKPKNIATLGTGIHYEKHLSGMIAHYYDQQGIASKIHFINRLDYATSGLTILAKHQYIHGLFAKQKSSMIKKYFALVTGEPMNHEGQIDGKILKLGENTTKRIIDSRGQSALTEYRFISKKGNDSLIECTIHTGRTHQIRVHLSSIGHPLVDDELYGGGTGPNFYLQSFYLSFIHPIHKNKLVFELMSKI